MEAMRLTIRAHCGAMIAVVLAASMGCEHGNLLHDTRSLVPQTVVENPQLPSIEIEVFGESARIHYRAYGFDPQSNVSDEPVVFLLHGSLSDMRGYLGLAADLAESRRVFMWDMRGNGLSERVPAEQLDYPWMAEEIEAVRRLVAPNAPIILLGYSWSGTFATLYAAMYPENIEALILLEPPGLTGEYQSQVGSALNLFGPGYLGMTYLSEIVSPTDHARVDFRGLAILEAGVRDFFVDSENRPTMPVWRVGGLAVAVWESKVLDGFAYSYDFTIGLESFDGPVLLLGTDYSPIGFDFQSTTNATEFVDARVVLIENAGHRMIVEQPQAILEAVTDFLQEINR